MCLYVAKSDNGKPFVAKKDILVWKVINKANNRSYFKQFEYKQFTTHKTNIRKKVITKYDDATINKGFHSFITRKVARAEGQCCYWYSVPTKVVKMWIPKGSLYYIGVHQDLVSDLITTGDLKSCN